MSVNSTYSNKTIHHGKQSPKLEPQKTRYEKKN